MPIRTSLAQRAPSPFTIFIVWLAIIFLTGGSARGDVAPLLFLRPAAVGVCAVLLITSARTSLAGHRALLALAGATILLTALHLVPLPPFVWQALPERQLIMQIDAAVGLGEVWRPLSVAPSATWNAFYALSVPLSIVLFMTRIAPERWPDLVPAVLLLGVSCMILGVLQTAAASDSPLYPYRVSNFGAPIGLFANRNHTGAFVAAMLPLLAVFASHRGPKDESYRLRLAIMAIGSVIVLLFLLLLGSRAGFLLGFLGLAAMPLIHNGMARDRDGPHRRIAAGLAAMIAVAAVIAIGIAASRAESLERLLAVEEGEDYRITTFMPILRLAIDYFPLGSGIGTFVETWQRYEPLERLEPRYLNHAHNDPLELLLTGGIPAILLILTFTILVARRALPLFFGSRTRTPATALKKGATVTLCLFALASLVDYPLRTPALSALAAIMLAMVLASDTERRRERAYAPASGARDDRHEPKMDKTR